MQFHWSLENAVARQSDVIAGSAVTARPATPVDEPDGPAATDKPGE